MSILGSIIGVGGSLLGGLFGKKSQEDANDKNAALQKEFAKNSVQWKVEDSKKAGIHPLYGLGAQTISPQPSYVGDTSLPNAMSQASQDIGRAITATSTGAQKAAGAVAQRLELERAGLQNDLLRAQIAEINTRATASPNFPSAVDNNIIPGQGNSGIKDVPLERITQAHNHPYSEPGPVSDVGWTRTANGGYAPVKSKDATERLEDDFMGNLWWNMRNRIYPLYKYPPNIDKSKYIYNPITGEYVPW